MKYRPKYKIEKFDEPVTKSFKDVKKYDVALFEFGDDDNWVTAVILDMKINTSEYNSKILETTFAYLSGDTEKAYDFMHNGDAKFDIIGTAVEIDYSKENDDLSM